MLKACLLLIVQLLFALAAIAQSGEPTRAEILRGSVTPEREWWDVRHYGRTQLAFWTKAAAPVTVVTEAERS